MTGSGHKTARAVGFESSMILIHAAPLTGQRVAFDRASLASQDAQGEGGAALSALRAHHLRTLRLRQHAAQGGWDPVLVHVGT